MAAGLIITIVVGAAGIIDYIRSLDLACSYSDTLAQGDLTQDVEQKYLDRKDSIGNLAAAFHKIRESFAGHLGSVKDNAESLSGHVSSIGKTWMRSTARWKAFPQRHSSLQRAWRNPLHPQRR